MNLIMQPGQLLTPIILTSAGVHCLGDIFVSGVEVPDQP